MAVWAKALLKAEMVPRLIMVPPVSPVPTFITTPRARPMPVTEMLPELVSVDPFLR